MIKFSELKTDEKGLIPVITQDYKTKDVLMMAYMNEEAFNKTLETNKVHYYSRSRQSLWLKGETSGHYQTVKKITVDCDADTLLIFIDQEGSACHTGNYSCFYREIGEADGEKIIQELKKSPALLDTLQSVYNTIIDRRDHPKEGSYTNYLFDKGIDKMLKKVGEETAEVIIGAKNADQAEITYEISDLLYHLMVVMVHSGVTWEDLYEELRKRM